MRVAHFIQRYPPALGGSEAYFERLSRHLAAAGDAVTVWTSTALDLEAFWSPRGRCLGPGEEFGEGVTVRRFPLWRLRGRRYLLKPLSLIPHRGWQCLTLPCNPIAPAMWREAGRTRERYDVVHASAFPYAFPVSCGLRLARRLGVPFLLTPFLHLGDPTDPSDRTRCSYLSPALRGLLAAADWVFTQTPGERDAVIGLGIPPERVVLQGLGVDPGECTGGDRTRVRAEWGVAESEVVVGHLANASVEKGTVDLLRAAETVWQTGRRFTIVLAGPEMPNFRRRWETHPPSGPVRRLGVLSDAGKRDFFAGLDLFALPSRSDSFGLVLLEAWANGLPNLAYRAGGVADLVRHGEDGLLAPCGDVASLGDMLTRLVDDAALRQRLGGCGRERTRRDFRWADKLESVRAVMRNATESRPRVGRPAGGLTVR